MTRHCLRRGAWHPAPPRSPADPTDFHHGLLGARARAWCRVDLAGGTLDIWPLGLLHPGARTVNLAIDLTVEVRLTRSTTYAVRQDGQEVEAGAVEGLLDRPHTALIGLALAALGVPPVAVEVRSASPRGGGLGASSALAVALLAAGEALLGRPPSTPEHRAAVARDLEARLMGLPTGRQDHFPALLGGALEIRHEPGGEQVRRLEIDLEALGNSLVVAYTGESHFSAGNNWRIVRRRLDGEPKVTRALDGVRDAAAELLEALETADLAAVGRQMSREWSWRRQLADGVSTPRVEELLAAATETGAWGGKACGAGGGGCLALLCPPDRRLAVVDRLTAASAEPLPARPAADPLLVEPIPGAP